MSRVRPFVFLSDVWYRSRVYVAHSFINRPQGRGINQKITMFVQSYFFLNEFSFFTRKNIMNMKSSSSFFAIQKDSILLPKDAKNTESLPLHKNRLMYIYLCKSASSLFLKGAIRSVCVTRVQTTSKIFISLKERKAHRVPDKESHTFVCLQRVLWRHLIKKKGKKGEKKRRQKRTRVPFMVCGLLGLPDPIV